MRFVPVIQSFVDVTTLVKCKELRNRQHGWITQHVAKTTYDLVNLDHKDKDLGKP
jgi:ribosomal protein S17E